MNLLQINNLSFSYPSSSTVLFNDFSLQLQDRWTVIAGSNGCGKTTLLKLIAGILVPDSGIIRTEGEIVYCSQGTLEIPHNLYTAFWSSVQAAIAYAYKTDHKDDLFRLTRTLIQQLEKEALKIDDLSDILTFAGFILESGYPSPVREILDILMPQVNQCNIPFIRQSLARLAIKYCRYVGNVEEELEAFRLYYDATESYMAETNKEYVYFLNLRNDLDELRAKNAHLLQQATTDALTGLPNRLAFNEASERAFDKAYVDQTTLAVEILDIDDFKHFNDTLGHQNGDLYLKTLGTLLSSVQKEGITAFRYGGDEFVLLYEGMSDEEILAVATGIKEKVPSLSITADNGDLLPGMTISQGICQSIPKGKNRTWDFLYAADHALYDVKRKNKNDVSLMNELIPMPERFRS